MVVEKGKFPLVMKFLATTTTAATVLLLLIRPYWHPDWWLPCTISFGTTAYHFVMRLAVGYLLPKLTNYDFDYRNPWFQPRKWEAVFYKRLRVKSWKGKLPTYAPSQFSLKEQSLYRMIQNMCGAELVHEIIMVLSFLPLLTVPLWGEFWVFLITSVLAALFDSIFVMTQRHNRPRLVRIYEKQEAKICE
jgi:hypothetical protein